MVGRLAVLMGCALGALACTGGENGASQSPPDPLVTFPPPVTSTIPTLEPDATTATTSTQAPPIPSAVATTPHTGPLSHFLNALRALERGERKSHVRILWLGDSHAQADFWPDVIRAGLQQRFGNAGPGFVHLGFPDYRHADVKTEVQGKWRFRPKKPSTVEPSGDGAFGLGGMLHAGFAERRSATIQLTDEALADRKITWDLCYKFGLPEDKVALSVGDSVDAIAAQNKDDVGVIRHLLLESRGPSTLKADIKAGRTDFCGVVIETVPEPPGVVLDNLGINGARYATALAWNEGAWGAEVVRRTPDLIIYEYGGNEASDGTIEPNRYKQNALDLIARGRRVAPQASCLVIGPSDRADAEHKIPPIVEAMRAAASEADCFFWDTYAAMGGKGSLRRWRDEDKGAPDGVHLKPKGYAEVGALMLADVMRDYAR